MGRRGPKQGLIRIEREPLQCPACGVWRGRFARLRTREQCNEDGAVVGVETTVQCPNCGTRFVCVEWAPMPL